MTMNCLSLAIFIFILFFNIHNGLKGYRRNRLLPANMKKAQKQTEDSSGFPEQWHKQILDHFNTSNTEYWNLKSVKLSILGLF